jgi:quercetin dioxygenase-like cupin family protein
MRVAISQGEYIMRICSYRDIKPVPEVPGVTKREVITAADGAPTFCMRVFEIEPGSSTPSHSHAWEHEVFVLSGRGVALSEQGETPIARDSVVFVPPNEHHCFHNNGDEILRIICLIPIVNP